MKHKDSKSRVHPELEELDLSVSSFGEIKSTLDIDQINRFLDNNVADKKLSNTKPEEAID